MNENQISLLNSSIILILFPLTYTYFITCTLSFPIIVKNSTINKPEPFLLNIPRDSQKKKKREKKMSNVLTPCIRTSLLVEKKNAISQSTGRKLIAASAAGN